MNYSILHSLTKNSAKSGTTEGIRQEMNSDK